MDERVPERRPAPGSRGDSTRTYVKRAQERVNRGETLRTADSNGAIAPASGWRGLLARLWPFRSR